MNPVKIIVGFIPFVLFSLLGNWLPVNISAAAALVVGLVILFANLRGGVKVVSLIQVVVLAAIAILGSLGNSGLNAFLAEYAHGFAPILLGLYILVTLPIRPFTEQYARAAVAREHWASPLFVSANRRLSAAWGVVVLALGVCHTISAVLEANHTVSTIAALAISWVVPVILLLWALDLSKKAMSRRVEA